MARLGRSVTLLLLVGVVVVAAVLLRSGGNGRASGSGSAAREARPATPALRTLVAARGELVQLSGRCPLDDGDPLGPVEIHERDASGATGRVVRTDATAASWTVDWRAPLDASTAALRIWCGDGAGLDFPADREISLRYRADPVPVTDPDRLPLPPLPDT